MLAGERIHILKEITPSGSDDARSTHAVRRSPTLTPMSRRVTTAAVLAVTALLAAGCGGSGDSGSSDATPTEEWADELCSSIATWTSSLTSIVDTLRSGELSQDSLTSAVDDAKSATETFTTSLSDLGTPDTEAGQEAKDSVDTLVTDIKADMTEIEDAVDGASGVAGAIAAVPTISSTLSKAAEQVSDTLSGFQDIDAKGELESAFESSSSCQDLTGGS